MPGMSGVDLLSALLMRGYKVPMVFITAFPDERLRRQVEASGAFGFLANPLTPTADVVHRQGPPSDRSPKEKLKQRPNNGAT